MGARTLVVGLGRVGLPTAVLAARSGPVVGYDRDPAALERLATGRVGPEPGLAEAVSAAVGAGRLSGSAAPVRAEVTVICVPTPVDAEHRPDLRALDAAVEAVAPVLPPDGLLVITSTVPVGTTDAIAARLRREAPSLRVAYGPERVLPGDALRELVTNPRAVGGVDGPSGEAAARWFAGWATGPLDIVDARTAELAKLAENAARDVALATAYTLDAVARAHGLDPRRVASLVNRHPRVKLLDAGIGVGGHCLPVDPWLLDAGAPEHTALLRVARGVNDAVPGRWARRLADQARALGVRRIGLLGLAYKPDVDDARGSPAVGVARALAADHDVLAADPYVDPADPALAGLAVTSVDEVLRCGLVALLVAHRPYVALKDALPAGTRAVDACGGWA